MRHCSWRRCCTLARRRWLLRAPCRPTPRETAHWPPIGLRERTTCGAPERWCTWRPWAAVRRPCLLWGTGMPPAVVRRRTQWRPHATLRCVARVRSALMRALMLLGMQPQAAVAPLDASVRDGVPLPLNEFEVLTEEAVYRMDKGATPRMPLRVHHVHATNKLRRHAGHRGDDDYLIQLQIKQAEAGHVPSLVNMGDLHYYGARGVPLDHRRAFQYYDQAAQRGSPVAQVPARLAGARGADALTAAAAGRMRQHAREGGGCPRQRHARGGAVQRGGQAQRDSRAQRPGICGLLRARA